ncbi:MAG: ribonuclease R [Clostridiales bacterium]|jgi:ribonuclease R|nr:ribonuclease R [Clostridiales bacterium]
MGKKNKYNEKLMGKKNKHGNNQKPATPGKNPKSEQLTGIFEQNARGFGFILPDGEDSGAYVSEYDTRGAFHGDRVRYILSHDDYSGRIRAEIRQVCESEDKLILGVFHRKKRNSYVKPLDNRFGGEIRVLAKFHNKAQDLQLVMVSVKRPANLVWMDGRIVEVLGFMDEPGVQVLGMIKMSGAPYEFPETVLNEAEQVEMSVTPEKAYVRRRIEAQVITIDGEDTKDVDDAVSLTLDENGVYALGVHIADVTHYVKENTDLDKEAIRRGTSIYLADRVIPMLPQELSNGICSLNEGADRLALSCVMDIDADGTLLNHDIVETVINVGKHMTYPKVTALLNGESVPEYTEYTPMLKLMNSLCLILKKKRENRGAISFDLEESKAELDENGRTVNISLRERGAASEIIEEFMLICNETVAAEYCAKNIPFIYRVHEEPDPDKLRKLIDFARSLGYRMKTRAGQVEPKSIQDLINRVKGRPEENIITKTALRSLKRAKYYDKNQGHYGLAAGYYCHFTTPIRRYPDLRIHRIIKEELHGLTAERAAEIASQMPAVCRISSVTERRAETLERDVLQLKKCEYMRQYLGQEFEGIISGVTSWGIFVELPNTVEGVIRLNDLNEPFEYNAQRMALLGILTGRMYKLGDAVSVAVARVDLEQRQISFELRKSKKVT